MRGLWAASLLLAGCQETFSVPPPLAPESGAVYTGLVRRYTAAGFVPAAGARVTLAGRPATLDAQGGWQLSAPPGPVALSASLDGHAPVALTFTGSLAHVHLALLPLDAPLAGVLTDPRGAALPGGTVVATGAALPAGRAEWIADPDGYWIGGLAATPEVRLAAHGTTPGGIPVETTTLAATGGRLKADRARPLGPLRLVSLGGGLATVAASGLPTDANELKILLDGREVAPVALSAVQVTFPLTRPAMVRLDLLGAPGPTLSVP